MNQKQMSNLYSSKLTEFLRILKYPVEIYPDIKYIDANDVDVNLRRRVKRDLAHDPDYVVARNFGSFLPRGEKLDRKHCVYVFKGDDIIGNIKFVEILDNPHGYGKDDFHYSKFVYPKYRFSKYSRYMIGDLIHMLFMSNYAKRLYVYVPLRNEYDINNYWMHNLDLEILPCMSEVYETDSSETIPYIKAKDIIRAFKKMYQLIEFDGDIYRKMDHKKYLSNVPGRSEEVINRWLIEMNNATSAICYESITT